jgi:hypothetical protein
MASSNPNIPSQNYENFDSLSSLSPLELARLRELLNDDDEADSNYTEYAETTHAWAVFADNPEKRATKFDRLVGTIIIIFQLFTYYLFARYVQPHAHPFICGGLLVIRIVDSVAHFTQIVHFFSEAIEDYQLAAVPGTSLLVNSVTHSLNLYPSLTIIIIMLAFVSSVLVGHQTCLASNEAPYENFQCQAEFTSHMDAFVAFFMLSIFLTPDLLQAVRAIRDAPKWTPTFFFATCAGLEVLCAYIAATIAISYNLYIGEVTDAVEVGVGLLFIRELSTRAYHGIRHKGVKQYKSFLSVLVLLVALGFGGEALYEHLFAP